jgi:cAMP phosphodiesterase
MFFHYLLRESQALNGVINSLHALARFYRKPNQRIAIGVVCPEFAQTRWLYGHHIFSSFVLNHLESINELPGNQVSIILSPCECA